MCCSTAHSAAAAAVVSIDASTGPIGPTHSSGRSHSPLVRPVRLIAYARRRPRSRFFPAADHVEQWRRPAGLLRAS